MKQFERIFDELEFLQNRPFSSIPFRGKEKMDGMRMKMAYELQALPPKEFVQVSNLILKKQNGGSDA